ncbi:hypothetical protein KP509_04G089900 [Ceratopteris richardii]|uniref:PUM-HD domain-containing protein n=1 Tax=Ceratopteris richardii TaxID=49495 RepID=A0A8T2V2Q8_CERRI|nr:hypothetical protein KP509_04G089900 [Ceratopteris richardii]
MGESRRRLNVLGVRRPWFNMHSAKLKRRSRFSLARRYTSPSSHGKTEDASISVLSTKSLSGRDDSASKKALEEVFPTFVENKPNHDTYKKKRLKAFRNPTNKKGREYVQQLNAGKNHMKSDHFSLDERQKSERIDQNTDYSGTKTGANPSLHPLRKRVDHWTLVYFETIHSLLGAETKMEDDERMALIEKALEETHGKECELACDKSCSRVLELLISLSGPEQIASFLHRLSPSFYVVSTDPAGSHVAEAVLKCAALILQGHASDGVCKTLEQAFIIVCQVVGDNIVEAMTNSYGSHVLRSLLCVLSSFPLELTQKRSRGGGLSSRVSLSQETAKRVKQDDVIFPHLLQLLIGRILDSVKMIGPELCMDAFAGPVLQITLRVLAEDISRITMACCVLLGCKNKAGGEGDTLLDKSNLENIQKLTLNDFGSHLVEVMLEVAPDDIYQIMLKQAFMPHLLEYALHPYANFVVQALIGSIRKQDQVVLLLSNLKPSFWKLMEQKRSGILLSLLKACKQYQCSEQEVCSSLAKALNSDGLKSPLLILRLLFLESYMASGGSKEWRPNLNGQKMSVLGCAMLQLIFSFPMECSQLYWLSLLNIKPEEILATVKDLGGCHVIESFLSSKVPLKHKNLLIGKLKGHFVELANSTSSSFTLERCFSIGSVDLKEAIVSELVSIQVDLAKCKHGPHLAKSFDIAGYSKDPDHWRKRIIRKEGALKAFADVFDLTSPKGKKRVAGSEL